MRKRELEKLLFQAVADALGVDVTTVSSKSETAAPPSPQPGYDERQDRAAA